MKLIRSGMILLLCLRLAVCPVASAGLDEACPGEATGILDEQKLTGQVEAILDQLDLNGQQIAVGFYYSGTGDTYFYHGDSWIYSASLYKVPLYMALDIEAAEGRIRETGTSPTLAQLDACRDRVLINSVNSTAHMLMEHFGSRVECRKAYLRVSTLPEDYFSDLFYNNSYFTARFMTDVMAWLLKHGDENASTLDSLYRSPLREDLSSAGERYEIAQKYGDYTDQKVDVHNLAAIIDTPTPIIVVVMTDYVPRHRPLMNAITAMLADYSLELDQQMDLDAAQ